MHLRLLLAICVGAMVIVASGGECIAQTGTNFGNSSGAGQIADLKDQLEKGLKCRRPQEFAFVAAVVEKVENEDLTRQIVVETFAYARKKATKVGTKYAFPYFARALEERAKQAGTPLNIDTTDLYPVVR